MFLLPFIIVLDVSIGASVFASKKEGDFFLANRSIRWPMLLGTFVGTQVGGGFILGNTEAAFQHGVFGSMYGLGIAIGMLLLGSGFGARLRALHIGTLPELLERRYGSRGFQKIAGIVSILSPVSIVLHFCAAGYGSAVLCSKNTKGCYHQLPSLSSRSAHPHRHSHSMWNPWEINGSVAR